MRPAGRMLVVAGHDPTGGAGVDADREAARRFEVGVECVVTANTLQDGTRVHAIGAREPERWLAEARGVCEVRPGGVKAGLLPGAEHVRAFAVLVRELRVEGGMLPVVVDPVLAASGGEVFLDEEGQGVLLAEVVPLGVVLTPNVLEAARLTGSDAEELVRSGDARVEAARKLIEVGARAVVIKGGHAREDPVRDLVVVGGGEPVWCGHARVLGGGLHGSGCRFASALCAGLVRGWEIERAVREAGEWVGERIGAGGE